MSFPVSRISILSDRIIVHQWMQPSAVDWLVTYFHVMLSIEGGGGGVGGS
jgi:hypothetical protein